MFRLLSLLRGWITFYKGGRCNALSVMGGQHSPYQTGNHRQKDGHHGGWQKDPWFNGKGHDGVCEFYS